MQRLGMTNNLATTSITLRRLTIHRCGVTSSSHRPRGSLVVAQFYANPASPEGFAG